MSKIRTLANFDRYSKVESDGKYLTPTGDGSQLIGVVSSFDALTDTTVSTVNPTITENLSVGHIWINSTTGGQYVCIDATANANNWARTGAVDEATALSIALG